MKKAISYILFIILGLNSSYSQEKIYLPSERGGVNIADYLHLKKYKTENFPESEISYQKDIFLKQFEKFKTVFNSKDISGLNEYINPEYGFFVLDNPVSFGVNAYHFNSFDTIFNNSEEWHLYKIKKIEIHCKPKKGKLPVYGCEEDENHGWNKEGCFYNNDFENNQLSEIYSFIERTGSFTVYGEENYNETLIKAKFKENADQIYSVFYSTEFEVGLYFGEINGKFYLLMIDLVSPCSA